MTTTHSCILRQFKSYIFARHGSTYGTEGVLFLGHNARPPFTKTKKNLTMESRKGSREAVSKRPLAQTPHHHKQSTTNKIKAERKRET